MIQEKNEELEQITQVWKEYQDGLAYEESIGLFSKIEENINFYEGRQWAKPTPKTKALPRPVVNIVRMITDSKKSSMNNTPVKIVYQSDNEESAIKFTRFNDYICKEMGMNEIDSDALLDGGITGNYVKHYYWDTEARGKKASVNGAVRCELVDIRNIVFANPNQRDEQKQKYIIIATREEVDAVKEYARASKIPESDIENIIPDTKDDSFSQDENECTGLCTVLTKYYKKDGEVWCVKACKGTIVKPDFALSLDLEKARRELGYEDEANTASPDNPKESIEKTGYRATLYPINVGQYIKSKGSIYGISEVEGLIPNQKCINLHIAMLLYAQQQMAWSKWVVKPDALKGQEITNEAGQVLIDNSKLGNGIVQVTGQPTGSNLGVQVVDNILSYTRAVTGSTEVMTGEIASAGMSGTAIAQLQAQAQQPIEEMRNSFWRFKEREGNILEQFYRIFYAGENVNFSYTESVNNKSEIINDVFNVEEIADIEFTAIAKATNGTRSSTAGDINFLDNLLQSQVITVEQYVKAYPDDALSNKDDFIKIIEESQQSELVKTKQLLMQREQELIQASKYLEDMKKIVNEAQKTNNENEKLRGDLAVLYQQYIKAIDAGQQVTAMNQELYNDATLFAQEIANNMENSTHYYPKNVVQQQKKQLSEEDL